MFDAVFQILRGVIRKWQLLLSRSPTFATYSTVNHLRNREVQRAKKKKRRKLTEEEPDQPDVTAE